MHASTWERVPAPFVRAFASVACVHMRLAAMGRESRLVAEPRPLIGFRPVRGSNEMQAGRLCSVQPVR